MNRHYWIITCSYNEELNCYEPHIDQAPPRTLIADPILWEAFYTENHPYISIRLPAEGHGSSGHAVGEYDCWIEGGRVCFYGAVVTLTDTNRTVVYRIGDYREDHNAWEAAWPD